MRRIGEELAKRDSYVTIRDLAERTAGEARARASALEAERTEQIKEIERLTTLERQGADKREQLYAAEERGRAAQRQLRDLAQRLDEARTREARRAAIEAAHAQFQGADEEERRLAGLFQEWRTTSDELHA